MGRGDWLVMKGAVWGISLDCCVCMHMCVCAHVYVYTCVCASADVDQYHSQGENPGRTTRGNLTRAPSGSLRQRLTEAVESAWAWNTGKEAQLGVVDMGGSVMWGQLQDPG